MSRYLLILFVAITGITSAQKSESGSKFNLCGKQHKLKEGKIYLSDGYLHLGDNIHSFFFKDSTLLEGTWNEGEIDSVAGYYDANGVKFTRFSNDHANDFVDMIANSELPDRDLIVRVLQMSADPDKRLNDLKNMGKTYSFLQKNELGVFSNGLALIYSNGKYGFVNQCMEMVIPPKYSNAGGFVKDYALVKEGVKWIKIDQNGKPLN